MLNHCAHVAAYYRAKSRASTQPYLTRYNLAAAVGYMLLSAVRRGAFHTMKV